MPRSDGELPPSEARQRVRLTLYPEDEHWHWGRADN